MPSCIALQSDVRGSKFLSAFGREEFIPSLSVLPFTRRVQHLSQLSQLALRQLGFAQVRDKR